MNQSTHSSSQPLTTAHPWHGLSPVNFRSIETNKRVKAYIEMSQMSDVKMEVDKDSGHLIIDRPNTFTNHLPCLYGFIPQTYCESLTTQWASQSLSHQLDHRVDTSSLVGDQDPLDICVFTQCHPPTGGYLVHAQIIGGLCMIDGGEVDDKIIAVLVDDSAYGHITHIDDLPQKALHKLCHYFLTYKEKPVFSNQSKGTAEVALTHSYNAEHAIEVIRRAHHDYLVFTNQEDPKPGSS